MLGYQKHSSCQYCANKLDRITISSTRFILISNLNGTTALVWLHNRVDDLGLDHGLEVIKLFFMLNSAEHEIHPAHKC